MRDPRSADAPRRTRVLVVDDEPLARDCIRVALEVEPDVEIVGECADGEEAVESIRRLRPDIVFLDVQMPELDGFGVVERVGPERMPAVVFVTAFDAHALRAFEVHAVDYLLKPFDDERLLAAFRHARQLVAQRERFELGQRLAAVVREWTEHRAEAEETERLADRSRADVGEPAGALEAREGEGYTRYFTVRVDDSFRFVAAKDIEYLEADGNYVVLHLADATYRIRGGLHRIARGLDPAQFIQIHRSVVVSRERIREVQPWFGGDYVAILRSGAKLRVSRSRAPHLLRPTA